MAVERLGMMQELQVTPETTASTPAKKSKENVIQMAEKVTEKQTPKAIDVTESFDFNKLPIGFVLKVGKKFFADEQVFRFYYNQNHPEVYKNKTLLMEQFAALVIQAEGDVKAEITPLLKEQLAN